MNTGIVSHCDDKRVRAVQSDEADIYYVEYWRRQWHYALGTLQKNGEIVNGLVTCGKCRKLGWVQGNSKVFSPALSVNVDSVCIKCPCSFLPLDISGLKTVLQILVLVLVQ